MWHRAWEEQDAGDGVGRHQLQQLVIEAQDVAEGPAAGQADPWGKSVVGNLLENLWEHILEKREYRTLRERLWEF